MYPRHHILLGIIFALLFKILIPETSNLNLALIFLAAVFIDLDHYLVAARKNKSLSISKSLKFYDELEKTQKRNRARVIKARSPFMPFHTIEFHFLVLAAGFLWSGFFYLLIGMVFHSLTDFFSMIYAGVLYEREYFLTKWLIEKMK